MTGKKRSALTLFMAIWMMLATLVALFPLVSLQAGAKEDARFQYVALGASNVNGYGMHGYLKEELYETPWAMGDGDISGYGHAPEGSYTDVIRDLLGGEEKVELHQLAMSSMRAAEIRVLLDENFEGDAYTRWRFSGSQSWFNHAGGIDKLRGEYRTAISKADLITLDIGANDFGVYLVNQLFSHKFENDLHSVLDDKTVAKYYSINEWIVNAIKAVSFGKIEKKDLEEVAFYADTLVYALINFCVNFDESVKHILALNGGKGDLVVVSIQNVLYGINAKIGNITIPFGDIFGKLIEVANDHITKHCPYRNKYYYADIYSLGNATTFIADFRNYNGDPETICEDLKDAFDVYESDLCVKFRVRYFFVTQVLGLQMTEEQLKTAIESGEKIIDNAYTFKEFENLGAIDGLEKYQQYYNTYNNALNGAYDGVTSVLKFAADLNDLALDKLLLADRDAVGDYLMFGLQEITMKNATVCTGEPIVTASGELFELDSAIERFIRGDMTGFMTKAELCEMFAEGCPAQFGGMFSYNAQTNEFTSTVDPDELIGMGAISVRIGISNCLCSHPNLEGHKQLAETVLKARANRTDVKDAGIAKVVNKVNNAVVSTVSKFFPKLADKIWKSEEIMTINVNSTGHKTVYKFGEKLDLSELTLSVIYPDFTSETIAVTPDMVKGFNRYALPGVTQELKITYKDKSTFFKVKTVLK